MDNFTSADMMAIIILGFGIVFCVLALIYAVLVIMRVIFYDIPNKKAKATEQAVNIAPMKAPEIDDDEEIAAVLTVIAAAMNTDVKNIRLNSLTQTWQPTFKNDLGGNENEKLYSKDKWKNI